MGDVDTPSFSFAEDPSSNSVWLSQNTESTPELLNISLTDGKVRAIQLPIDQLGGQSKTRIAPDGSIWVTDDYRLLRVDPGAGKVDIASLDEDVTGELPTATSGPSQGTWVSAITFDAASDAIIARHNVPGLTVYTPTMAVSSTLPLVDVDAGLSDMTLTSAGLTALGPINTMQDVSNLQPKGSLPQAPVTSALVNPLQGFHGDATNVFAIGASGATATLVQTADAHTLNWTDASGKQYSALLPQAQGTVFAPNGDIRTVSSWPRIYALLPLSDGTLLFVAASQGAGLYALQPSAGSSPS